ncbi:hypothetical protein H3H37_25005 [Duganella sp. LX20W]|uniref:Uncharacterized protein n=1 Tax=Rugamonas brunnea TaxID=2758569 RepID=A0A7W2EXB0_9BURK|nr:hypothetical protein [Rugamonas brunnea]MBA5640324.1 hypothetical protein [Rugamonas brunnea]
MSEGLMCIASIPYLFLLLHAAYVLSSSSSDKQAGGGIEALGILCVIGYIVMSVFNVLGVFFALFAIFKNGHNMGWAKVALFTFVGFMQIAPFIFLSFL